MHSNVIMNASANAQMPLFVQVNADGSKKEFVNLSDCHRIVKFGEEQATVFDKEGNDLGNLTCTKENKQLLDLIV